MAVMLYLIIVITLANIRTYFSKRVQYLRKDFDLVSFLFAKINE